MNGTLILFTNTYPFGKGEEFIETEIPVIAERFDRVCIIATQVAPDAAQTRAVPNNVDAHAIRTPQQSMRDRLTFLGRGLPAMLRSATGRRRALEGFPHPKRWAASAFFEARAQYVWSRAKPIVADISRTGADVTVYSFWLHLTARVGELARDLLRAQRPGQSVRFISRAHNYDLYHEPSPMGFLPQRRPLLRALDAVYPVSQAGVDYLVDRYPEAASKISVQRLGSREPVPAPLVSRERCYVTSCSYAVPVKRLTRFPAIVEALAERGVPVTWTHIGGGPELDAVRAEVERVIQRAEVKLVGHVDNATIFDTYAATPTTMLVNLSTTEGLPVSMMEAISGGIPIVATQVGGVAEIVRPGVSGQLIPADFTDAQAVEAIERYWNLDDAAYADLSASARQLWEDEFRASTAYERFAELLTS